MMMVPVPAGELDNWLPLITWHLGSFSENGLHEPEDFIADIRDRKRQLWIAWNGMVKAVCLTAIADDRQKSCLVTHCAGSGFRDWAHMIEGIANWARAEGCQRIEATTRPGWEKALKKFGLTKSHVVLEKRL
ncbi:MAG: hypothetical protein ACPGSI_16790 [Pikeienuella sp.]